MSGDTLHHIIRWNVSFIEGDPSEWEFLPLPDGSFKVGIDGGYVRNWWDKKHNFEVALHQKSLLHRIFRSKK
jgi:hypothetical protein